MRGRPALPRKPRHIANTRLTYAPAARARASVTAELVYVGEYFTDPANEHTYAGYSLVNAYAAVPVFRALDAVARVNNVGDVRYATTASFNPFVAPELQERFGPGQPRTLFVGLQ